jgi:eukaryotic-like serine/threonine-protein kinase
VGVVECRVRLREDGAVGPTRFRISEGPGSTGAFLYVSLPRKLALTAGSRLGPYEILSPLGAGGMGEVYRAKDPRLGREVAIKVLPASFSTDADRLRRFEQEARAAGLLNHPNITSVFDIGSHDGSPYVVSELLEGETLRAALAGGHLSARRAVDHAVQLAEGLAAAHEKGIVHRDLKPENVFVTRDGRVKILDFGLAKLTHAEEASAQQTNFPTATAGTEPGVVMGTMGYMAPEQVRGRPADARSDIFSFGAILYEMLSGKRAFHGDSAADTMSAILREDPPDLSVTNQNVSPGLERILRHCLEKNPERRFQSARDLAFDLEALSGLSVPPTQVGATKRARPNRVLLAAAAAAVFAAVLAGVSYFVGKRAGSEVAKPARTFQSLSFAQQAIFNARFAPDGKTVVYSAARRGNTPEIVLVRPDFPGGKPLGLAGVHLLSVSSRAELAVLTRVRYIGHSFFSGTLGRMPLEGGAPREVLAGVREADWSPDGSELAIIRDVNGKDRLEYPVGKVLAETGGYLSNPRVSPDGKRIAFFEHPTKYDDRGGVAVVDLTGGKKLLSDGYWGEEGLAWSPDSREVLFSAGTAYNNFKVYAVALDGRLRIAAESAGGLTILDVAPDGRWIASRDDFFRDMLVGAPGESIERDLSWLDLSAASSLSPDGKMLLFSEEGGSVGVNYAVCLRSTGGSAVVRLGEGSAQDLSRDGNWALGVIPTSPQQLVLYPTGAGEARKLERGGLLGYDSARFFPDGKRVLACGHEAGRSVRCYQQSVDGGPPRPVTPEGSSLGEVSPDGRMVAAVTTDGLRVYPVDGGSSNAIPGTTVDDQLMRWDRDEAVLVFKSSEIPATVERVDVRTGKRDLVRQVAPPDLTGVLNLRAVVLSEDGRAHAYTFRRMLSHLFLVDESK